MVADGKNLKSFKKYLREVKARASAWLCPNGMVVSYYNVNNFGDQLTPDILKYYGIRPFHTPIAGSSEMIGVGSVLHMLPSNYDGTILGSGFISGKDGKAFPHATVALVRGHLSRKLLQANSNVPVGDPGLIVDCVYGEDVTNAEKKHLLGIVPHYKDKDFPAIDKLKPKYGDQIKVIDVCRDPKAVVMDIASCNHILSSSLHGLVVSDSLAIPNAWLALTGNLIGGEFKFHDYYSAFDVQRSSLKIDGSEKLDVLVQSTQLLPLERVSQIKDGICEAFTKFVKDKLS